MMRLGWLPRGETVHLLRWVGPMRFRCFCNHLADMENDADSVVRWPALVEGPPQWPGSRTGGRVVLSCWDTDMAEEAPPRPICVMCRARWRQEVAAVERILAARP